MPSIPSYIAELLDAAGLTVWQATDRATFSLNLNSVEGSALQNLRQMRSFFLDGRFARQRLANLSAADARKCLRTQAPNVLRGDRIFGQTPHEYSVFYADPFKIPT